MVHGVVEAKLSQSPPEKGLSDISLESDDMGPHTFDFVLINPFIVAVKEVIEWELESQPLQKVCKYL